MTENDDEEEMRTYARRLFGAELDASAPPESTSEGRPTDHDSDRALTRKLFHRPTPTA